MFNQPPCLLFCEVVKEIWARKACISALHEDQKSEMGIYCIRCFVNGKVYIGSTVNFRKRWTQHKSDLRRNRHRSHRLQNAWNKYGCQSFVYEILVYVYKSTVLAIVEDEYIRKFKSANRRFGFNVKPFAERMSEESRRKIGDAHRGKKVREETRQKIREARKGKLATMETRQKMSEAHMGLSAETRKKLSEAQKGRKYNMETRQKMSASQKGKKHSKETREKMREIHKAENLSGETRQKMSESARKRYQK